MSSIVMQRGAQRAAARTTQLPAGIRLFLVGWTTILALPEMLGGQRSAIAFSGYALLHCLYLAASANNRNAGTDQRTGHGQLAPFVWAISIFLLMLFTSMLLNVGNAADYYVPIQTRIGLLAACLTFFLASFMTFWSVDRDGTMDSAANLLLLSIPVFVLANVLVALADIGRYLPDSGLTPGSANSILAWLGMIRPRMNELPSIISSNSIGALAGLSLVIVLGRGKSARRSPGLLAVAAVLLLVAVLAETRSAMIAASACLLCAWLLDVRRLRMLCRILLICGVLSPFLLLPLLDLLGQSDFGALFVRAGDLGGALGFGTGRAYIWQAAVQELSIPRFAHLIGFGYYGQISSGIINDYLFIFPDSSLTPSLHNAYFQLIFDMGYIGEIAFAAMLWIAIDILCFSPALSEARRTTILASLLFLLIVALTEAVGTLYHFETFLFLLGVIALALVLAWKGSTVRKVPTGRFGDAAPAYNRHARRYTPR